MRLREMWQRLLSGDGRVRLIVALGLIGMGLVLLSQFLPDRESDVHRETAQFTSGEYRDAMEAELASLITGIEGVGRARVMVTLENGFEYRYAKEEKRNSDTTREGEEAALRLHEKETLEESYLLVERNGERQPLLQTEVQPRIQGVVIVCDGAGDAGVQLTLTAVVTTALDIPSTRVYIARISGDEPSV